MDFKDNIRVIPDFPQPGISFKDITTLLKDGEAYRRAIDELKALVAHLQIDVIAGPEARGFVVGAPLAYALGVGFVPIRKSGKLPYDTIEVGYDLEYGKDTLAIHTDAVKPGQNVLIADDLLATGGTIATSVSLVKQLGGNVVGAAFLIELTQLAGRNKLSGIEVHSLLTYED
ncbi:adenine phosphoribosyltransferase [Paenibacillus riograndensis]|uniref:Adenine phosphoribosyltransferase n=2 Tax=Paenibacillus riograndensis TaxID=483937 RepID=A0A132U0X2_9BACL|nr:adenine phosphoribosyltransferase [Paenibacillus riograndensis]KWX77003.1 adenine phosphoribosyltransferase [Paenibacillus riograndensis]CQR57696.1 Adenine phosphoribosyltransferase [Paenibacillus riograndensis SBR5]